MYDSRTAATKNHVRGATLVVPGKISRTAYSVLFMSIFDIKLKKFSLGFDALLSYIVACCAWLSLVHLVMGFLPDLYFEKMP